MLSETNPEWKEFTDELEKTGQKPRTNPDGDVGVLVPGSGPPRLTASRSYSKVTHMTSLSSPTVESA